MPTQNNRTFRRIIWPFAVAETIVWASFYYSFPAILPEWERSLGWSKTELSGAFTTALILSAVLAPFVGRMVDRGHSRLVFAGSAALGSAMLIVLSQINELWQFYMAWAGIGIAMAGALYEACFAIVTKSVGTRNKQAITLITLVGGFAGTVSFPTAHHLISLIGWRGTILVFAVAVLCISLPLIWYGCRNAERFAQAQPQKQSTPHISTSTILRSATFWFLALAFGAIAVEHGMILTHLLPIMADRGISSDAAVLAASMIGPMQVVGRLAMMMAEKHVSIFCVALGCSVSVTIAAACLLGTQGSAALVVVFVILHGAGYGVTSITRPVITANFLGRQSFGVVSGMLALPFMLGFAISPTLAAMIWEFGGYDLVIELAILTAIIGLCALIMSGEMAKRSA